MKVFDSSRRIVITCSLRLAPYLEQELLEMGFTPTDTFPTRIELEGTMQDCIRLNLNLRCASQVLFSVSEFSCNSPDDLYKKISQISWEEIIPASGYFSVKSNAEHPSVNNSMFVNVKVKDAIADRFRKATGKRPD